MEKKDEKKREFLLNTQMIVDDLEEVYSDISFEQGNDAQTLIGIRQYYGQERIERNFLYIAEAICYEKYPIIQSDMAVISVGTLDTTLLGDNSSSIIICSGVELSIGEVYNRVQEIFDRYYNWVLQLKTILNYGGGVDELCRAALNFFNNPLFVHDEEYNVLSYPRRVEGMMIPEDNKKIGCSMVPSDTVNEFKFSPTYRATLTTYGAQIWDESPGGHRVMYVNIWDENKNYIGRLLIGEKLSAFKPGQFRAAEYFVEVLRIAMIQKAVKRKGFQHFEEFVKNMMLGKITNKKYIQTKLDYIKWNITDEYLCMKVEMDLTKINILSVSSTCNEFEKKIGECCAFFYQDSVWVLINLSCSKQNKYEVRKKMSLIIRESLLKTGVSNICKDFIKIPYYFKQAEKALSYGEKSKNTSWYYDYYDYAVDDILRYGCENIPNDLIGCEQIKILEKYDAENDTELYKTLKVYLQHDRNITHTSEELFIHRSTLSYRLIRIQEITGLDLEDFYTRLYLCISFHLHSMDFI